MTKHEIGDMLIAMQGLWPSKWNWTDGKSSLWAEQLARVDVTLEQATAVIRDEAANRTDGRLSMPSLLARLRGVNRPVKQREAVASNEPTASEWAVIRRDREAAMAWRHGLGDELPSIVAEASRAYPMFREKFERHLDPKFKPGWTACMELKCGWQRFHDAGEWVPNARLAAAPAG